MLCSSHPLRLASRALLSWFYAMRRALCCTLVGVNLRLIVLDALRSALSALLFGLTCFGEVFEELSPGYI